MNWLFLIAAGLCEIFYAAAMPRTEGFTRLGPSLFCAAFIAASMYLLSLATRSIPVGTAYAVWVGIGAVGTAAYGMLFLDEDRPGPHGLFRHDRDGHCGPQIPGLRGEPA
jgi:quaternary ammonium compound-resistance protein SugE